MTKVIFYAFFYWQRIGRFEPSVPLPVQRFSRPSHSTTLAFHRKMNITKTHLFFKTITKPEYFLFALNIFRFSQTMKNHTN